MSESLFSEHRGGIRKALLLAATGEAGVRVESLDLTVAGEPVPVWRARRVAAELIDRGMMEGYVRQIGAREPAAVRIQKITKVGDRYLAMLEQGELR